MFLHRVAADVVLLAVMGFSNRKPAAPCRQPTLKIRFFSAGADLVGVHVTVTDRRGAYVTGLSETRSTSLRTARPKLIDLFRGEDSPVTVGLLVDSSGSLREGGERVIAAATAFAKASRSEDERFVLTFNDYVRAALSPSTPFTTDATAFRIALADAMTCARADGDV